MLNTNKLTQSIMQKSAYIGIETNELFTNDNKRN